MYSRYRPCLPTQTTKPVVPYCPPVQCNGPGAVAESTRLAAHVAACGSAWVQTIPGPPCSVSKPSGGLLRVAVPPAGPIPVVEVRTTPASLTTQQAATATLFEATNPYDPATRFSQYFPPPPIPYECPVRYPNNDPKPSVRDCVPVTRFMGSAQQAAMEVPSPPVVPSQTVVPPIIAPVLSPM